MHRIPHSVTVRTVVRQCFGIHGSHGFVLMYTDGRRSEMVCPDDDSRQQEQCHQQQLYFFDSNIFCLNGYFNEYFNE